MFLEEMRFMYFLSLQDCSVCKSVKDGLLKKLAVQTAWVSVYKSAVTGDLADSDEFAAITLTKDLKIETEHLVMSTLDPVSNVYIEKVEEKMYYRVAEAGVSKGTLCTTSRRFPDRHNDRTKLAELKATILQSIKDKQYRLQRDKKYVTRRMKLFPKLIEGLKISADDSDFTQTVIKKKVETDFETSIGDLYEKIETEVDVAHLLTFVEAWSLKIDVMVGDILDAVDRPISFLSTELLENITRKDPVQTYILDPDHLLIKIGVERWNVQVPVLVTDKEDVWYVRFVDTTMRVRFFDVLSIVLTLTVAIIMCARCCRCCRCKKKRSSAAAYRPVQIPMVRKIETNEIEVAPVRYKYSRPKPKAPTVPVRTRTKQIRSPEADVPLALADSDLSLHTIVPSKTRQWFKPMSEKYKK